jgi:hypothetical protein
MPYLVAITVELVPSIIIRDQLSHPTALTTEDLLASGKDDDTKRGLLKKGSTLHIHVSREQMSRALRLLNELFLAVEEQGCIVFQPEKEGSSFSLTVDGEVVEFRILRDCSRRAPCANAFGRKEPLENSEIGPSSHRTAAPLTRQPPLRLAYQGELVGRETSEIGELPRDHCHSLRRINSSNEVNFLQPNASGLRPTRGSTRRAREYVV